MKIEIELSEYEVAARDRIAASEKRSREAVVQEAIAVHLAKQRRRAAMDEAFGLWGDLGIDGVEAGRIYDL